LFKGGKKQSFKGKKLAYPPRGNKLLVIKRLLVLFFWGSEKLNKRITAKLPNLPSGEEQNYWTIFFFLAYPHF
jgi:hypothetical protein